MNPVHPAHPGMKPTRLRVIGVMVLLLGTAAAVIVGFRGRHSADLSEDPAMARYYRQEARQAEVMYGGLGTLANDIRKVLKRPSTQAILIGGGSVLVGLGCFFFARLAEVEEAQSDPAAKP
jgi:hypothetical protein